VQNIWKPLPAGCCGPISVPHKKMRIITVEQDHYLLDIFLYDEYFEKLSFLSVGDKISINAPRTLVYSYVPREIADGQSLKIAKQFMPFTIALYPKVSDQCRVSFFFINNIKLISRRYMIPSILFSLLIDVILMKSKNLTHGKFYSFPFG